MANTLKLRSSTTSGAVPATLAAGEAAVNLTDNRLFFGTGPGVQEFNPLHTANLPVIRPSLLLDYVNNPVPDPRQTFTRASGGGRFNAQGLYKWLGADVPRIDYDPVTGECLGILIEEQRTNLLLNSATLATQSLNLTAGTYTLSFYGSGTVSLSGAYSGTVVGSGVSTRKAFSFTATAGTLTLTVSGSCTSGQLEAGAFPTSYIPTISAQVTRAADVASVNTLSPWFNTAEGAVIVEASEGYGTLSTSLASMVSFDDGTTNNRIQLRRNISTTNASVAIVDSGSVSASQTTSAGSWPVDHVSRKVGFAFGSGSASLSLSGTIAAAGSPAKLPSITQLKIGGGPALNPWNGHIKSIRYYPKRLTNAELQELTA